MAMPNHLGQINATGDDYALFLKKWSGEILTTFEEANVMAPLHMVRSIDSGKSAQFPVIGTAQTKYHTPGDSVIETAGYLSTVRHGERLIFVDKMLTSSVFVARVDELINHYDVRSVYSTELGRAMAKKYDEQLLLLSVIGAFTAADVAFTGAKGGNVIRTSASGGTTAQDIINGIRVCMQELDEKDVPKEDRAIVVSPATFYKLIAQKDLIDRDISPDNGSIGQGTLYSAWGGRIYVSNHLPGDTNYTDATNVHDGGTAGSNGNDYRINLTSGNPGLTSNAGLQAVVFHKSALGTVNLMSLGMESEYQVERQGSLFVSKYALGHGVLRPEACCALITSAGSAVTATAS